MLPNTISTSTYFFQHVFVITRLVPNHSTAMLLRPSPPPHLVTYSCWRTEPVRFREAESQTLAIGCLIVSYGGVGRALLKLHEASHLCRYICIVFVYLHCRYMYRANRQARDNTPISCDKAEVSSTNREPLFQGSTKSL